MSKLTWRCVGVTDAGKTAEYWVVERHRITGEYRTRKLEYDVQ